MGIFDRLGDVIRSYLNDEDSRIFGRPRGGDPDIEEAEAELESFLRGEGPGPGPWASGHRAKTADWGDSRAGDRSNSGGAWSDRGTGGQSGDWGNSGGAWAKGGAGGRAWNESRDRTGSRAWGDGGTRRRDSGETPEKLRPDFAELGLPFGAGAEECKAAYRRLLKLHHPDRHAGHQGNMEKATKKMAKINAAYDRIEKWRAGEEI